MGMNFGYAPFPSREESIALIRKAVEQGITFFDTAEVYGPYTNETLVGQALAPFKSETGGVPIVIATKFGFEFQDGKMVGINSRPDNIRKSKAHAVQPVSALQNEYSLWTRQHEAEIIPTINEPGSKAILCIHSRYDQNSSSDRK